MRPMLRHAVVAALSAAVAFGVSAPAATAAPTSKAAHVKTTKATAAEKKAAAAEKKLAAAAKKAAAEKRQVIRDVDRRDAALARVVEGDRLAGLDDEVVTVISANVAADRSALAGIRSAVVAGGGQNLREVRVQLRAFRVETYNVVVGIARDAVTVAAEAAANDAALADLAVSGVDVTEAQAANTAAVASANSALAKALLLSATSHVRSRADVEADMAVAFESLVMVAAFLEAQAAEEPAAEEPAAGEPTETL